MTDGAQRQIREAAGAVLLWLLVPAGAQLGIFLFEAYYPDAVDPVGGPPASLVFGVIGLVVGAVAAVLLSWRLGLGLIWFGVALVTAAIVGLLALVAPPAVVVVAVLLIPPIVGALVGDRLFAART